MKQAPLGQSGIPATVIGFGAWAIDGWMWGGTEQSEAIAAIQAALDNGVDLIDTAPVYGFGGSEEIVGKAIAGRRDQVVLATKCGLRWDTDKGAFYFELEKKVHRYLGVESIRYEIEESLRRLGTDVIDLYQTHWQEPTTPIEDTMATLLDLKQEGKIRAIGVSNCSVDELEQYRKVGPVDTAQEKYSMIDRAHEADLMPYCRDNGIGWLCYSPLSRGLLTGRFGAGHQFNEGDTRAGTPRFSPENCAKIAAMLADLEPIAGDLGVTTTQLVIAWTIAQPGVTHVLCGARKAEHILSNIQAAELDLNGEAQAQINAVLDKHTPGIE